MTFYDNLPIIEPSFGTAKEWYSKQFANDAFLEQKILEVKSPLFLLLHNFERKFKLYDRNIFKIIKEFEGFSYFVELTHCFCYTARGKFTFTISDDKIIHIKLLNDKFVGIGKKYVYELDIIFYPPSKVVYRAPLNFSGKINKYYSKKNKDGVVPVKITLYQQGM